ncbi:protein TIFY 10A-like [Gastrolobium bilobum]|uniref:protein TIFY 10A-like n=1 Tax=Gastrolobium bilobum TaxID=150636 RepID=UPI002AB170C1|nr:protein TIFY 10A-like [Gastrolobium bilobum]
MSSSSEYSGFSGNQPAKSQEKSSFSQTCSLLSQYLKEKGSFGDLTLGITCNTETNGSSETSCHSATTMELFPTNVTPQQNLTTMDLLSPQAAYPRHTEVPTLVNSSAFKSTEKEPKSAQLTMFYAGQVIVFDDFPAHKVEEMMAFATKGISQSQNSSAAYTSTHSQPSIIPNINPQIPSRPILCDLPIARKASLHRFLEKRKDRIAAKAPYKTSNPITAPNKPVESMSWLGLGAKSTQI